MNKYVCFIVFLISNSNPLFGQYKYNARIGGDPAYTMVYSSDTVKKQDCTNIKFIVSDEENETLYGKIIIPGRNDSVIDIVDGFAEYRTQSNKIDLKFECPLFEDFRLDNLWIPSYANVTIGLVFKAPAILDIVSKKKMSQKDVIKLIRDYKKIGHKSDKDILEFSKKCQCRISQEI